VDRQVTGDQQRWTKTRIAQKISSNKLHKYRRMINRVVTWVVASNHKSLKMTPMWDILTVISRRTAAAAHCQLLRNRVIKQNNNRWKPICNRNKLCKIRKTKTRRGRRQRVYRTIIWNHNLRLLRLSLLNLPNNLRTKYFNKIQLSLNSCPPSH
jgi:hypothetical protein